VQNFLTDERLEAIFKQFDIDESKSITRKNIKDAFSKLGKEISDSELDKIMKEHDTSNDGSLQFDEFR